MGHWLAIFYVYFLKEKQQIHFPYFMVKNYYILDFFKATVFLTHPPTPVHSDLQVNVYLQWQTFFYKLFNCPLVLASLTVFLNIFSDFCIRFADDLFSYILKTEEK